MASFIKIPTEILQDKKLNHTQILLYGIIMNLSKKEWYCRASNKTIWDAMWLTINAVQKNLIALKNAWHIEIEIEDYTHRKIYMGGYKKINGGVDEIIPYKKKEYISSKEDIIPPQKNEEKTDTNWKKKRTTNEHLLVWEKKEQFQKFWETYPHYTWRSNRKKSIPPFLELDTEQVLLWAALLKWETTIDSRQWNFVKAAELWLRNFTPINEEQKRRRLKAIFDWHMRQPDWKKERMEMLVHDFPWVDFKQMREELSEKNSLLHKMTFT